MFNKNITLIVPSLTQEGIQLNLQNNKLECLEKMTSIFGGATATQELDGAFKMSTGIIMNEKVVNITSFFSENQNLEEFFVFVQEIKIKYNQECIAFIFNGEMRFV